ncbi:hypothetical protein [Pyrobaculum aerophilum]|nr:hypothetical protein [Pyrobaculum aerophilum]
MLLWRSWERLVGDNATWFLESINQLSTRQGGWALRRKAVIGR